MQSFRLSPIQKETVLNKTSHYIELANNHLSLQLKAIPVNFDLKGKSSGMFVVKRSEQIIRYNEIIFSQYFDDALMNTVAHEVAHYVVHSMWGIKRVKPHGKEWQQIMALFDVKADVTSDYKVDHLPLNRQKLFKYTCDCMNHQLTTTRHNKVQRKNAVYKCRHCLQILTKSS